MAVPNPRTQVVAFSEYAIALLPFNSFVHDVQTQTKSNALTRLKLAFICDLSGLPTTSQRLSPLARLFLWLLS